MGFLVRNTIATLSYRKHVLTGLSNVFAVEKK